MLRYQGVDSDPVNWGWLCDKGRFDFEAVNSEDRLRAPLVPRAATSSSRSSWTDAARRGRRRHPRRRSTPAAPARWPCSAAPGGTNEDAYAWAKLAKGVIGTDNVDAQLGDGLPGRRSCSACPGPRSTRRARPARTVVLLGPDLKEELPVLYLRLRDAGASARRPHRRARRARHRPHAATPWQSLRHRPGEQARAGARPCSAGGPPADGVGVDRRAASPRDRAARRAARSPSSSAGHRWPSRPTFAVDAAAALLAAVPTAPFLPALRRGNVRGALDMGLAPGLLPGRRRARRRRRALRAAWPVPPPSPGSTPPASSRPRPTGRIDCLVLLGADPLADFPDRDLAERGARRRRHASIAVDTFLTASSQQADVVLAGGRLRREGRHHHQPRGPGQPRSSQKVTAAGTARADWMIAAELADRLGADLGLDVARRASGPRSRGVARSTPASRRGRSRRRRTTASSPRAGAEPAATTADPSTAPAPPPLERATTSPPALVEPQALRRRRRRHASSPSLAGLAPGAPASHLNPLRRRPPRRRRRARRCRSTSPDGRRSSLAVDRPTPACPRAWPAVGFNQPGVRRRPS